MSDERDITIFLNRQTGKKMSDDCAVRTVCIDVDMAEAVRLYETWRVMNW
jgi:hypothetical protein